MTIEDAEFRAFEVEVRAEFRAIRQAVESTTALLTRHQDDLGSLSAIVRKNAADIVKLDHTSEMSNKELHDELRSAIVAEERQRETMLAEIRGMMKAVKIIGGAATFIGTALTILLTIQTLGG